MDPWCGYYFGLSELSTSPAATRAVLGKILGSGTNAKTIWEKFNSFPFVGHFGLCDQEEQVNLVQKAIDHMNWVGISFPEPPEEIKKFL